MRRGRCHWGGAERLNCWKLRLSQGHQSQLRALLGAGLGTCDDEQCWGVAQSGKPQPREEKGLACHWEGAEKKEDRCSRGDMSFGMEALRKGKCGMLHILMMVFHCSNSNPKGPRWRSCLFRTHLLSTSVYHLGSHGYKNSRLVSAAGQQRQGAHLLRLGQSG